MVLCKTVIDTFNRKIYKVYLEAEQEASSTFYCSIKK